MDVESLKAWYLKVIGQYADFSGRARRAEFWSFALVNFVIYIALGVVGAILGSVVDFFGTLVSGVSSLYSLAVLIPSLSVGARRLHDTGKSGWLQLLWFIPILGWIYLIYLYTIEGDRGDNAHGPDPKAEEGVPVADWNG